MAVMVIAEVPGQTEQGYDGMLGAVEGALKQAPGFIFHSAHPVDGGWRVIEVWQSQQDATDFFAKFVHPNLPPGVKPRRTIHELHSFVHAGA